MPDSSVLFVFIGIAFLFAASPGPNFVYVLTRSLSHGSTEGLVSVLGIISGALVHTVTAVIGLSALLLTSSVAFSVVKFAGAAYLIYLGIKTLLSTSHLSDRPNTSKSGLRAAYQQGFITMLLNPKAALYYFSFLPQFVNPEQSAASQLLILGLIQTFAALTVYTVLTLVAASARSLFLKNIRFRQTQRYLTSLIYIALGGFVALSDAA